MAFLFLSGEVSIVAVRWRPLNALVVAQTFSRLLTPAVNLASHVAKGLLYGFEFRQIGQTTVQGLHPARLGHEQLDGLGIFEILP
jgi:hypothetical protein